MFKEYDVWKRHNSELQWSKTSHVVKARTDKEAQSRVRRMFDSCGFSSMSLLAMETGQTPNATNG
jgi:hypothetical protein